MDTVETLHHKADLDLDFVPPLPESNHPRFSRLYFFGIRIGLSIESVDLRFKHRRDRCSSVYGTIYMNDSQFFRVHTLYNRASGQAERMAGPSGGPLTLCGPKYFVAAYTPKALYVDLYEAGKKDPFFREKVPLKLGYYDFPTETISVDGEEATLTICMTAIFPCTLSNVSLELSSPQHWKDWLVSGSVTAIQTVDGGEGKPKVERRVSLFKRPHDHPLRAQREYLRSGQHKDTIKLDREVLLAPLLFDREYILEMDRLDKEYDDYPDAGIDPDNDRVNGVGSYLTVSVDLRLVNTGHKRGKPFPLQGTCCYQFKCSHASGALFRATFKRDLMDHGLKRRKPKREIELSVTLRPSLGITDVMDEEPYECDMDLYRPSRDTQTDREDEKAPSNTDTETDSEDEEEALSNIDSEIDSEY